MTKERGILFRTPMVRALLNRTKTQTRRPVKKITQHKVAWSPQPVDCIKDLDGGPSALDLAPDDWEICPYGVPGEKLWVRETFDVDAPSGERGPVVYKADMSNDQIEAWEDEARQARALGQIARVWTPSIFMPRWASRITLTIEKTRVERLHMISLDDARAEGIPQQFGEAVTLGICKPRTGVGVDERDVWDNSTSAENYKRLLRGMHKLGPDDDPWLWAITFSVEVIP